MNKAQRTNEDSRLSGGLCTTHRKSGRLFMFCPWKRLASFGATSLKGAMLMFACGDKIPDPRCSRCVAVGVGKTRLAWRPATQKVEVIDLQIPWASSRVGWYLVDKASLRIRLPKFVRDEQWQPEVNCFGPRFLVSCQTAPERTTAAT